MDTEDLRWYGPAQMTNGGELVEIHTPPVYPGLALVYTVPAKRSRAAQSSTVPDGPSLLAEFDARAQRRREQVAAEFQAFDQQRSGAKKAARKKRRNKAEMQAHRAAVAERITKSYEDTVPAETRAWLDEPDPLLDSILKSEEA